MKIHDVPSAPALRRPRSSSAQDRHLRGHGWLLIFGVMSACCLLASGIARADDPPSLAFNFPYGLVPGGQFAPNHVALDSSGNIYVSDSASARVVTFSSTGVYLTNWGNSIFGSPIYSQPSGIAVDWSTNVYVSDGVSNKVYKFATAGTYLGQWGGFGTAPGQFQDVSGIAVDASQNVYACDRVNNRIQKFTSSGGFLGQWGTSGTNAGQFSSPQDIAVGTNGNVYVTDTGNNRVQVFTTSGAYLSQWGSPGTGPGQFTFGPGEGGAITVDGSNNVYVTDNYTRIQKFAADGTFLTQWNGDALFYGLAADPTGNLLYAAVSASITVFAYSPVGPPIIWGQPTGQTVASGVNVTLAAEVFGALPLSFQWLFNGTNLTGATNVSLTLTNVTPSQSGSYALVVTNSIASAMSSNVVVIVEPGFAATQPAYVTSPTTATLNGMVTPGGSEAVVWFQWGYDTNYGNAAGATVVPAGANVAAVNAALTGLATPYVYHYRLVSWNNYGLVYGADQQFTMGRRVVAWGAGTTNTGISPNYGQSVVPPGLTNVAAVAAGVYHSLALKNDGTVVAWGDNTFGQTTVPAGLTGVVAIACADRASFALKNDGTVAGWGPGYATNVPAGLNNVVAIAGVGGTGLALRNDGSVVEWEVGLLGLSNAVAIAGGGTSRYFALANDGTIISADGAGLPGTSNIIAIAGSLTQCQGLALKEDRTVISAGPVPPGLSNIVAIASGSTLNLALDSSGTVTAWGSNTSGQTNVPRGLNHIAEGIAAGGYHALALTSANLPTVTTFAASAVSGSSALLNASVSPNGADTAAWFQWGTSTNYGGVTGLTDVGAASGNAAVSNLITGLGLNTLYHYRIVASNVLGTVRGLDATFTMSAPFVTVQPQPLVRYPGPSATFSVGVGGIGPFAYQWMFDDTNLISGATNSTYALANVQLTDQGLYSCVISNLLGSNTSRDALLTVLPFPTNGYAATVLADTPIAYWPLGETSGTEANDLVGGHDGQYTNVTLGLPGFNPSDPDTAIRVGPATNSFVANIQGIDFATTNTGAAFSVECWVNGPAQNPALNPGIVTKGTGIGGEQFDLDVLPGYGYRWFVRDSASNSVGAAHANIGPNNTWQHLVAVFDGPNLLESLYVNGALAGSASFSDNGVLSTPHPVTLGSRQSSIAGGVYDFNFNGRIDEVAIYNYALTPDQVLTHYASGTNLLPVFITMQVETNGLQLLWPLGQLQAASQVTGPYTDVTNAASPYLITPSAAQRYYRLRLQ